MSERNTPFLLEDIKESIENSISFTKGLSFDLYCSDIKTVHAVQHNFMIIGEAVARIPEEYKLQHQQIDWRQIKDFRNIIVHDYFGIDSRIVWDIIRQDIPGLLVSISALLAAEEK
jgi:uncharacterized protein with HEPN domain